MQPATLADALKPFLCFETLTFAPFDRQLLAPELLNADEIAWLDAYHAGVAAKVGPKLNGDTRVWLERVCRQLNKPDRSPGLNQMDSVKSSR